MTRCAIVVLVAAAAPAAADDAVGDLVMDGHDAAHIIYADRCSNGANADRPGFDRFVDALRADPKSKLAKVIAEAEAKFVHDKTWFEITLGDWQQTYHLRDGCADNANSWSAFVFLHRKMGNSNDLITKYVVTIDDDLVSERRNLKVRSVVPLALRDK